MKATLKFQSSCTRAGNVLSADEQVMMDIDSKPKRIRAVCELALELLGARGRVVVGPGAQLENELMQIDVEIRLARESPDVDEGAYWRTVRRQLGTTASEAQQERQTQLARPEAAGDGRHAAPADPSADPKDTVSTTSPPSPHSGEADQEGGSVHGCPDLQPRDPEVVRAPQSPADSNNVGEPPTPERPEGGSHQAVSVYPDGRTRGDHAASGGPESGEPTALDGRPQSLLLQQESVDGPGVQVEDAPVAFPGADEPLGERRLEQHVDGNWTGEPGGSDSLVDPPRLMLQPPVAQVDVVCIERQIVRLVRLHGWRSPEVLITTDPKEDPIAVKDNLSERLFGLPVLSRGLFKLGKFWLESTDEG